MPSSEARPQRATALCAALQGIGGGLGWSVLPPLMQPISAELQLSHVAAGLVWGAAPLGIALASPFGGAAGARFGARRGRCSRVAMRVGGAACAARALAHDTFGLALAMFCFGLHIGFVAPSIPKAL